jgi:hypothetical protein
LVNGTVLVNNGIYSIEVFVDNGCKKAVWRGGVLEGLSANKDWATAANLNAPYNSNPTLIKTCLVWEGDVCPACTPPPAPTITASSMSICAGGSTTLSASGITVNTAATYTATCTVGTCVSPSSTIVIGASPFSVSATKTTITAGESTILTASCCNNTISWPNGQTGNSITVNPSTTTLYVARCGPETDKISVTISITVNQPPCTPITGLTASVSPSSLTTGASFNLNTTGTGLGTGTVYAWSGPSFSSTNQNPTGNAPATAGNYSYSVTATNSTGTGTCTASAITTLSVSNTPTPCTPITGLSIAKNQTGTITAGTALGLSANKTDAGTLTSYTWTATGGVFSNSAIQNPSITFSNTGTYILSVTAQNNSGTGICTATATASVSVSAVVLVPCSTMTVIASAIILV